MWICWATGTIDNTQQVWKGEYFKRFFLNTAALEKCLKICLFFLLHSSKNHTYVYIARQVRVGLTKLSDILAQWLK